MTEDLEHCVAVALRTHGDGAVDVAALRVGSVARARSIRRRRVGLGGVALTVALVGVSTAVTMGTGGSPMLGGGASPSTSAPGRLVGVSMSLPLGDDPGAAVRPDLVGKDPGTIHFEVDTTALGASGISFYNRGGVEAADVWNAAVDHYNTWYYLSQQPLDGEWPGVGTSQPHDPPTTTEVFGRPATSVRYPEGIDGTHAMYRTTWQPVDGLYATVDVETDGPAAVTTAVDALKLARSQRCVAPFQLTSLPAGYRWTGCDISLGPSKPWEASGVWLTDASGRGVIVDIGNYSLDKPFAANTTVGRRPAQWVDASQQSDPTGTTSTPVELFIPVRDWVSLVVRGTDMDHPLTQADATQLGELVTLGPDLSTDPARWPVRPVV